MTIRQLIKQSIQLYFLPVSSIRKGISTMPEEMLRIDERYSADKNLGRFFMGCTRVYFLPLTAAYAAWISRISNNQRDESAGL